ERLLASSGIHDHEIAEPPAPRDHVCNGLAVQRHVRGHFGKIAVRFELEHLADARTPVRVFEGDAQVIGITGLLIPGPVDVGGWLLTGKIQRERMLAGGWIYKIQRLSVIASIFL